MIINSYRYASGIGGNDSDTVLLLPFDGSDGATSTTDTSVGGSTHTITFGGTAQLDTAEKKFGSASLLLDGNSDYITAPDSADWAFGTGDFTIDMWTNVDDPTTSGVEILIGQYVNNENRFFLYIFQGSLRFLAESANNQFIFLDSGSGTLSSGWNHVALVRSSNTWDIYYNGTSVDSNTASDSMPDLSSLLYIGQEGNSGSYFSGHIDELRVSKGVARWTTDFTPPTEAYST